MTTLLHSIFIFAPLLWLVFILSLAAFFDVKSRRIPNLLVVIGLIGLFSLQLVNNTFYPLSLLVGLLLGLTLWQVNMIGGGDSKLLVLASMAFSLPSLAQLYFCITIAGAIQALYFIIFIKQNRLPYAVAILGGTAIFLCLDRLT